MNKIQDFQKRGGINSLTNQLQGIKELSNTCSSLINDCEMVVKEEEDVENNMRATHGAKWTVVASSSMNDPFKKNIQNYRKKVEMAVNQDKMTESKFNQQKSDLNILMKTRQELSDMIPQSQMSNQIMEQAPAVALKNALGQIDQAKERKQEIIGEATQHLSNLNFTEELLKVHTGSLNKETLFGEKKKEITDYLAKLNEQDELVKSANKTIVDNFANFEKLKKAT